MGLAFKAYFLHDFPIKILPFNSLSMDKVSMSHLSSFSRYQTTYGIKFLFRQLMRQWLTGKNEGKTKIQKSEYFENERAFQIK